MAMLNNQTVYILMVWCSKSLPEVGFAAQAAPTWSFTKSFRFRSWRSCASASLWTALKPWPFWGGTAETRFEHWVMMGINQVKYYKYVGGSIKWGIPNSWLVYNGESDLKKLMIWGCPHVRKAPYKDGLTWKWSKLISRNGDIMI